jgi:hypothetical protein
MVKEVVYNKLVRDNIPNIIINDSREPITHIAVGDEYPKHLFSKLFEEIEEFKEEPCEEELADMREVIKALIEYYDFSEEKIEEIRLKKKKERGAFYKKIILDKILND